MSESKFAHISELLRHVYGMMFFGVPNDGLDIESFIPVVGEGPNRPLINSLGQDNSQILYTQRRKFAEAFNFEGSSEIYSFYETRVSNTVRKVRISFAYGLACSDLTVF